MINILHLIEDLGIGGAERRLVNDLKYLDRKQFSHVICALRSSVEMQDSHLSDIPIHCCEVASLRDIFRNLSSINKIIRLYNIDIIHTQLFWADLVGRFLKLFHRNVKLISTIQNSAYEKNGSDLYSYKRKVLDGFTARLFNDGYIAVSKYAKQISADSLKLNQNKVRVIYNSVDLEFDTSLSDSNRLRDEFEITPGQKTLVTIGRLVPAKGHIYLIRAISKIKEKIPNIKLLILGEGQDRESLLRECSNLSLENNIIFAGKRKDARSIFLISDIFVFPSLYGEGMSLALLEAMASKVPCIATSSGPNTEVLKHEHNGLLVSCGNSDEIAKAVVYLFEHPEEMSRLGNQGFLTIKEKFCAQLCAKELGDYYMEISQ